MPAPVRTLEEYSFGVRVVFVANEGDLLAFGMASVEHLSYIGFADRSAKACDFGISEPAPVNLFHIACRQYNISTLLCETPTESEALENYHALLRQFR